MLIANTGWTIIILPALATAVPLHMDRHAGHSPSALAENNSNNFFFFQTFSTSAVHFVNPESWRAAPLKGSDACTPVLSHIIPRTNLFRSLTTVVPLIAQAPAIF